MLVDQRFCQKRHTLTFALRRPIVSSSDRPFTFVSSCQVTPKASSQAQSNPFDSLQTQQQQQPTASSSSSAQPPSAPAPAHPAAHHAPAGPGSTHPIHPGLRTPTTADFPVPHGGPAIRSVQASCSCLYAAAGQPYGPELRHGDRMQDLKAKDAPLPPSHPALCSSSGMVSVDESFLEQSTDNHFLHLLLRLLAFGRPTRTAARRPRRPHHSRFTLPTFA